MTQHGALSDPTDLMVLGKGIVMVAPNDKHGRAINFWDRSRMTKDLAPRDTLVRIIYFTLFNSILFNESAQKRGIVVIENLKGFNIDKCMDRHLSKALAKMLNEILPVKLKAMHVLQSTSWCNVYDIIMPSIKFLMGKDIRQRMLVHACNESIVERALQPYGIQLGCIPEQVGGTFKLSDSMAMLQKNQRELIRRGVEGPRLHNGNVDEGDGRTVEDGGAAGVLLVARGA